MAGEDVGGINGKNRLMGNSLLDIIVFGRLAGKNAAQKSKTVQLGNLTLKHIDNFANELKNANILSGKPSPVLLPKYTHGRKSR